MYAINANTIGAHLKGMHPIAVGSASFMITGVFYLLGAWKTGAFEVAFRPENWLATTYVAYLAIIELGKTDSSGALREAQASLDLFPTDQARPLRLQSPRDHLLPVEQRVGPFA